MLFIFCRIGEIELRSSYELRSASKLCILRERETSGVTQHPESARTTEQRSRRDDTHEHYKMEETTEAPENIEKLAHLMNPEKQVLSRPVRVEQLGADYNVVTYSVFTRVTEGKSHKETAYSPKAPI